MFGVKDINSVDEFWQKIEKPAFVKRTMLMAGEKIGGLIGCLNAFVVCLNESLSNTVNVKILVLLLLSFEFGCRTSRLDKIDMSRLKKAS